MTHKIAPFYVALIAIFLFTQAGYAQAQVIVRPITFPVQGTYNFRNDFSEPRAGGTREHLGIDIISAKMTPLVAAVDGRITFIAIPQASWGYSISITDSEGYSYRYLHMNNDTPGTDDGAGGVEHAYAPGLSRGTTVTKGQIIGWVGDSGNAEATVSHLHFEIRAPDRKNINPYDTLLAASGNTSGTSTTTVQHSPEASAEAEEQFIATRSLYEGMVDTDVIALHTELKTLGYYIGPLSELYSSVTREAVRQFQLANKLDPTGAADVLTRRSITTKVQALPATPAPTPTNGPLKEGSQGEQVRALQIKLRALGFLNAEATGYFGPLTRAAVLAFQKENGIDQVGYVGPLTSAALASATVGSGSASTTPANTSTSTPTQTTLTLSVYLERGAQGESVRTLQLLLARAGFFSEEATGYFGPITETAVIAFQNAHGIDPLGVAGPKTRAALNSL